MHHSDSHRRTVAVKVRLTPETKAKLVALAAAAGLPIGQWIEAQIAAYPAPRAPKPVLRRKLDEARRGANARIGEPRWREAK